MLNSPFSDVFRYFPIKHITCIWPPWIPSHCDIPGNESADMLAKEGASQEQPNLPVSLNTCKQIIKSNTKIEWLNTWASSNKGRAIFPYLTQPNIKDPINSLGRKDQVIIFRLRSQHVQLNMHLNRINPEHAPVCELCPQPYEHFLIDCPSLLDDIRKLYIPPMTLKSSIYFMPTNTDTGYLHFLQHGN